MFGWQCYLYISFRFCKCVFAEQLVVMDKSFLGRVWSSISVRDLCDIYGIISTQIPNVFATLNTAFWTVGFLKRQ